MRKAFWIFIRMKQEIIRSTQNPIVKFVASLKEKKFREREGLFLVEGRKMVSEGFARGAEIQTVYATEKFLGVFPEEKTEMRKAGVLPQKQNKKAGEPLFTNQRTGPLPCFYSNSIFRRMKPS